MSFLNDYGWSFALAGALGAALFTFSPGFRKLFGVRA